MTGADMREGDRPLVRPREAYRGSGFPGIPVDRNPGASARLAPDPYRSSWRSRRTAVVWTLGWELLRRLPERVAFALARLGARVAYRRAEGMRERVRHNLSRVVDGTAARRQTLDDVVRAAFVSYARYWVEAFRAADISTEQIHARTTTAGLARLDTVLDQGRGAIVLLAHHGSWDMAARWAESHGYHLAVVAEVLRPRQVFERFVRLREAIGLEVVPLPRRSSGRSSQRDAGVTRRLAEVLEANHLVGLLTDRDLSGKAPVVDFFGAETRIPIGAATLACRTGAPIVPITMMQRPDRRWHLQVLPVIEPADRDMPAVHAEVVRALEDLIRLEVSQWHAFQPIWPGESA